MSHAGLKFCAITLQLYDLGKILNTPNPGIRCW